MQAPSFSPSLCSERCLRGLWGLLRWSWVPLWAWGSRTDEAAYERSYGHLGFISLPKDTPASPLTLELNPPSAGMFFRGGGWRSSSC